MAIATTPLTFNAGETSKTITVAVNGDTKVESNETFLVNLSNLQTNGRNVTITDNQGQGTITNDDSVSIIINDVAVPEGNIGIGNLIFQVTLSGVSVQPVTVDYATADGTATAGSDYTASSGTLTFFPGTTSQVVIVPILTDTVDEPDETVFLNLSNATGGTTIAKSQVVGTLLNDDSGSGLIRTGTTGNDNLTGSDGNDTLTGAAGGDNLNGGKGADRFVYNALTDSLLGARDYIVNFNPGEGDRIALPTVPTSVFFVGNMGSSISQSVVTAAYAAANGNTGLGTNQAVFFGTGSSRNAQLYLSVNDGTAAFDPNNDLVMEVSRMIGAPTTVGSLTVSDYFV